MGGKYFFPVICLLSLFIMPFFRAGFFSFYRFYFINLFVKSIWGFLSYLEKPFLLQNYFLNLSHIYFCIYMVSLFFNIKIMLHLNRFFFFSIWHLFWKRCEAVEEEIDFHSNFCPIYWCWAGRPGPWSWTGDHPMPDLAGTCLSEPPLSSSVKWDCQAGWLPRSLPSDHRGVCWGRSLPFSLDSENWVVNQFVW